MVFEIALSWGSLRESSLKFDLGSKNIVYVSNCVVTDCFVEYESSNDPKTSYDPAILADINLKQRKKHLNQIIISHYNTLLEINLTYSKSYGREYRFCFMLCL